MPIDMETPHYYFATHYPGLVKAGRVLLVILVSALFSGCNMPISSNGNFEATQAAFNVQATLQEQQRQQAVQATSLAAEATTFALDAQATISAHQTAQVAQQLNLQIQTATPNAQPSSTPTPEAPTPTAPAPTDHPTEAPPSPTPTHDAETMMKSANILLFEDMAGLYEVRYIRNALDQLGLSYVDVGDASGDFKAQILSGTDWDLIIVGNESRVKIQGEFFDYLNEQLNQGTSVIIEMWALDEIASGKVKNIMTRCGVEFQSDWVDPKSPSIWWLNPENPIFHQPNEGISLVNFLNYWSGDQGDLIRLIPGGKATLLAGTFANEKSRYGTLATCMEGRLIIQTYSSHNYHQTDVERLWQNYIYNALNNHFSLDN